ncbi:GAF domain-containing protein [Marinobacterium nitratireducens]|uniref:GAF domain-containing protein n=1 Tax=Marinobacterium nitratireducens TaxID=518897 RepID=UPI001E4F40D1|nr:GAF domain-containing protein [Marinobacterium nitratireducens]
MLQPLPGALAELFDAEHCTLFLAEEVQSGPVASITSIDPNMAQTTLTDHDSHDVRQVMSDGQALLIGGLHDRDDSTENQPYGSTCMMLSPVRVSDRVFAVISVAGPRQRLSFDQQDLELLESIGLFVAKTIQALQLRDQLDSRLLQLALAQSGGKVCDKVQMGSVSRLDRMTRIVARSFYREMTRAGFGSHQIISAATQIISELNDNLQRYSKRSKSTE